MTPSFPKNLDFGKVILTTSVLLICMITGEREVFFELNGQLRSVMIKDTSVGEVENLLPKADPNILGEIGSPMKGEVVEMKVAVGDKVIKGQNLAVLSAMKMEMVVQSPIDGDVRAVIVRRGQKIEAEDLMIEIKQWKIPTQLFSYKLIEQEKKNHIKIVLSTPDWAVSTYAQKNYDIYNTTTIYIDIFLVLEHFFLKMEY